MSGMTVTEAARRLGISRQAVHKLIQRGKLQLVARGDVEREGGRFARGGIRLDPDQVEERAREVGK